MKSFIRFTENNDWEGESWNFYIPVEGNEIEIERLRDLINTQDDEMCFEMNEDTFLTEEEVDILVDNATHGYFPSDNKLDEIRCPEDLEGLYKGGLLSI